MLPLFVKSGRQCNAGDYRISFRFGRKNFYDCGRYWDERFGIRLLYKAETIACVAFKPCWRTIVIQQLQGSRGYEHMLASIRWERLLPLLVGIIFEKHWWWKSIAIIPASKCWYYGGDYENDKSLRALLRRRYDGTARALKFKFNPYSKLWVQSIKR
ncbi:MAG TPA: hypothetical protein VJH33_00530 [Candidatus Paceibacterota bacterium]